MIFKILAIFKILDHLGGFFNFGDINISVFWASVAQKASESTRSQSLGDIKGQKWSA